MPPHGARDRRMLQSELPYRGFIDGRVLLTAPGQVLPACPARLSVASAQVAAALSGLTVGWLPRQNEHFVRQHVISDRSADQIMWAALGLLP